jgi:uncharacterized protein YegL
MENNMTDQQEVSLRREKLELGKVRGRSALLISLIVHTIIIIVYLFLPQNEVRKETDSLAVDWVTDVPPMKRRPKLKPPLERRIYKPDKTLARDAKNKRSESSPNKITEVVRLSERIVYENLDVNKAPPSEEIPELMTDADLPDAKTSNLARVVTQIGRTDGQGVVTGRVRVRGSGNGRFLVDSDGDGAGGLLGGGGNPGIADRLGIINFLNEFEGAQQVVYCLDISASMQAAGLKKLELALKSIKDSMLMLRDDDHFNIITFSSRAQVMNKSMLQATMPNVERASKYLNRYTPQSIQDNWETNLLEAIEKSLKLNPSIIVLVTDGIPSGENVETRPGKILEIVREKNVNKARIFVVGLEIKSDLLVYLAEQHGGKLKFIDSTQLVQFAHPEKLTESDLNLKTADF